MRSIVEKQNRKKKKNRLIKDEAGLHGHTSAEPAFFLLLPIAQVRR